MNIAVFSTQPYDKEYFEMYKKSYDIEFSYFDTHLNSHTTSLTEGFDGVCVFVNDTLDSETIDSLDENRVKLIALRCAGFNNVNMDTAKKHAIKVVRVPSYSPEAVAEHAVALIQTLNRKTNKAYNRVREGNFSLNGLIGFNLYKKTIGVVGTGQIGAAFCRIMKGFGCRVVAFDINPSKELIDLGVEFISLDDLFVQSDIISLHCPLIKETKHMINERSLSNMKNGVMIINTSRGALINTRDVISALSSEKVGYLGIDVYEQEEHLFFQDLSEHIIKDEDLQRLNSFPNVLITSHQAYFTKEAMKEITLTTLDNIKGFSEGAELKNEVS